jgi:hypothetical protein
MQLLSLRNHLNTYDGMCESSPTFPIHRPPVGGNTAKPSERIRTSQSSYTRLACMVYCNPAAYSFVSLVITKKSLPAGDIRDTPALAILCVKRSTIIVIRVRTRSNQIAGNTSGLRCNHARKMSFGALNLACQFRHASAKIEI